MASPVLISAAFDEQTFGNKSTTPMANIDLHQSVSHAIEKLQENQFELKELEDSLEGSLLMAPVLLAPPLLIQNRNLNTSLEDAVQTDSIFIPTITQNSHPSHPSTKATTEPANITSTASTNRPSDPTINLVTWTKLVDHLSTSVHSLENVLVDMQRLMPAYQFGVNFGPEFIDKNKAEFFQLSASRPARVVTAGKTGHQLTPKSYTTVVQQTSRDTATTSGPVADPTASFGSLDSFGSFGAAAPTVSPIIRLAELIQGALSAESTPSVSKVDTTVSTVAMPNSLKGKTTSERITPGITSERTTSSPSLLPAAQADGADTVSALMASGNEYIAKQLEQLAAIQSNYASHFAQNAPQFVQPTVTKVAAVDASGPQVSSNVAELSSSTTLVSQPDIEGANLLRDNVAQQHPSQPSSPQIISSAELINLFNDVNVAVRALGEVSTILQRSSIPLQTELTATAPEVIRYHPPEHRPVSQQPVANNDQADHRIDTITRTRPLTPPVAAAFRQLMPALATASMELGATQPVSSLPPSNPAASRTPSARTRLETTPPATTSIHQPIANSANVRQEKLTERAVVAPTVSAISTPELVNLLGSVITAVQTLGEVAITLQTAAMPTQVPETPVALTPNEGGREQLPLSSNRQPVEGSQREFVTASQTQAISSLVNNMNTAVQTLETVTATLRNIPTQASERTPSPAPTLGRSKDSQGDITPIAASHVEHNDFRIDNGRNTANRGVDRPTRNERQPKQQSNMDRMHNMASLTKQANSQQADMSNIGSTQSTPRTNRNLDQTTAQPPKIDSSGASAPSFQTDRQQATTVQASRNPTDGVTDNALRFVKPEGSSTSPTSPKPPIAQPSPQRPILEERPAMPKSRPATVSTSRDGIRSANPVKRLAEQLEIQPRIRSQEVAGSMPAEFTPAKLVPGQLPESAPELASIELSRLELGEKDGPLASLLMAAPLDPVEFSSTLTSEGGQGDSGSTPNPNNRLNQQQEPNTVAHSNHTKSHESVYNFTLWGEGKSVVINGNHLRPSDREVQQILERHEKQLSHLPSERGSWVIDNVESATDQERHPKQRSHQPEVDE